MNVNNFILLIINRIWEYKTLQLCSAFMILNVSYKMKQLKTPPKNNKHNFRLVVKEKHIIIQEQGRFLQPLI